MIRKTKEGWVVLSEAGNRLSKPTTKAGAQHRLAQVEMFKAMAERRKERK